MRSLLNGTGYLLRGIRTFVQTPSVWPLGLIPVVLAAAIIGVLLSLLALNLDEVVATLTPAADGWNPAVRDATRLALGALLLGAFIFVVVLGFATLTNLVGQPFFEALSDRIERGLGDTLPPGPPWWRTLPRATVESLALLLVAACAGVVLLVLNLVPVLGQVAGALVWGYLLAVELLAIPLQRRGLHLRDRLRVLWRHRLLVTGFGVGAFLLFLVPLMNILAMPGAIVGGTLLVRHIQPSAPASAPALPSDTSA
jgi:CysZ protein